jgi:septation ring formation regulator EzrA
MKQKFTDIYNTVWESMKKLDEKKINVEQAKAMASLAKQANNVLTSQLDAAKFLSNVKESEKLLSDVGL